MTNSTTTTNNTTTNSNEEIQMNTNECTVKTIAACLVNVIETSESESINDVDGNVIAIVSCVDGEAVVEIKEDAGNWNITKISVAKLVNAGIDLFDVCVMFAKGVYANSVDLCKRGYSAIVRAFSVVWTAIKGSALWTWDMLCTACSAVVGAGVALKDAWSLASDERAANREAATA